MKIARLLEAPLLAAGFVVLLFSGCTDGEGIVDKKVISVPRGEAQHLYADQLEVKLSQDVGTDNMCPVQVTVEATNQSEGNVDVPSVNVILRGGPSDQVFQEVTSGNEDDLLNVTLPGGGTGSGVYCFTVDAGESADRAIIEFRSSAERPNLAFWVD